MMEITETCFPLGVRKPESQLIQEVVAKVREVVGPVASFKDAVVVKKLPKTRSGKIARNTIAAMLAGKKYRVSVASFYTT